MVPGQSSDLKKGPTERKKTSNLPFTELHSTQNNAVMQWLLAHCLSLNSYCPLTCDCRRHNILAGFYIVTGSGPLLGSNTHKQRGSSLPTTLSMNGVQSCLTFTLLFHITWHNLTQGMSLSYCHPQNCLYCMENTECLQMEPIGF